MSSEFVVWRPGVMKDGICKLQALANVPDAFELNEGISRAAGWPDDASASMSPQFAKDIGLADSLYGAGFLIVSSAVRKLLEQENVLQIEYLPIKIINHKGRVASDDYVVVNPLASVDCLDAAASQAEADSLDPGAFCGCEELVLRDSVIPAELAVFRVLRWPSVVLVRRTLADKLKAAQLTQLRFTEPHKFTGLV